MTDGDDNRSHVEYETLLRYARSAGAPIYFIAVNIPLTDFKSRKIIHEIAKESGGEVFTIGSAAKIGEVTHRIEGNDPVAFVVAVALGQSFVEWGSQPARASSPATRSSASRWRRPADPSLDDFANADWPPPARCKCQ